MEIKDMEIKDINKKYFLDENNILYKITLKSRRRDKNVSKVIFNSNDKDGYCILSLNGKQMKSHRLVMSLYLNRCLGINEHIDHKNGNKLDNSVSNLRIVSNRENCSNRYTHRNGKLLGTRKTEKGFTSQLRIGKNNVYLGTFENEIEANNMYNKALKREKEYKGSSLVFRTLLGYTSKRKTI